MSDNDKPTIEIKPAEDYSTVSVVVTFPFMEQAVAFSDICNTILSKMDSVAKVPEA